MFRRKSLKIWISVYVKFYTGNKFTAAYILNGFIAQQHCSLTIISLKENTLCLHRVSLYLMSVFFFYLGKNKIILFLTYFDYRNTHYFAIKLIPNYLFHFIYVRWHLFSSTLTQHNINNAFLIQKIFYKNVQLY